MRTFQQDDAILVTGGAGFVGSNLCRRLLDAGATVHCIDNLITGRRDSVSDLFGHPRFRFYECDIADAQFVWRFAHFGYREIYNLACPTGVPNIEILGEEMMETCSTGTANVLKLAKLCDASVLLTSSCEVYGDPEVFPQAETYAGNVDPMGPRSAYEEGKRFSEALVALYARKYGVDGRVVRIFNTFGPGMSMQDQRVIPQFLARILNEEPLFVFGDGSQSRTFLYVEDLLNGFEAVMTRGEPGLAYNIGGVKQLSIRELVEIVEGVIGRKLDVEYRPHFTQDHLGRMPDVGRVRALGWKPTVGLAEGLSLSMAEMKGRFENASRRIRHRDVHRVEPHVLGNGQSVPVAQ